MIVMVRGKLVRTFIAIIFTAFIILIWRISYRSVYPELDGARRAQEEEETNEVHFVFKDLVRPLPLRIVHFDLKGSPPKLSYLKQLLPLIVASGGNALLIEYEDTFPYEGSLKNISAKHAYLKDEIVEFLSLCDQHGLEVIPLVQTFGHLEYVLKLEEFMHLREEHSSPQDICPSNSVALKIVEEMIVQLLLIHKNSKRIHIGCDEVHNLNICSRCRARKISSRDIFVAHIKAVSKLITSKYPHIRPLIWDDMLRSWPAGHLADTNLNEYVEPVIWVYASNIRTIIPLTFWYWYFEQFSNIWIAGAYRGATSEMALIPDTRRHLQNQQSWLQFLSTYLPKRTRIAGYILTGWSRYDHFAALCELLPTAVPSMVLNLLEISSTLTDHQPKKFHLTSAYHRVLRCRTKNNLPLNDIVLLKGTELCEFPGQELIPIVLRWIDFRRTLDSFYTNVYERNPWMTFYHLERVKSTNFQKLATLLSENRFRIVQNDFEELSAELRSALGKYFNNGTVDEWFLEHMYPYSKKLQFLNENFEKLRSYYLRAPVAALNRARIKHE